MEALLVLVLVYALQVRISEFKGGYIFCLPASWKLRYAHRDKVLASASSVTSSGEGPSNEINETLGSFTT